VRRAPLDRRERDVREEIRFYLDERARELEPKGLPPVEARRRALEAFGNPDDVVARVMTERRPGEAWTNSGVLAQIGSAVLRVARELAPGAQGRPHGSSDSAQIGVNRLMALSHG
jgi:hypothetical protein